MDTVTVAPAATSILDLDALLAPLPGDAPCGLDLREHAGGDAVYFQLKDLRAAARAIERRADSDDEAQSSLAEWQRIHQLGTVALRDRTKDLEIAVWMTEAAVRLDGFGGLRDGFRLIAGLVERYWDGVFPQPDEDGIAVRLSPIGGLNGHGAEGTLIQPIRKVPLVPEDGDAGFAYWHYALAQRASQTPDTRNRPGRKPPPTLDELRQRAAQAPVAAKRRTLTEVRACRQAFRDLDRLLTERCGGEAPPTSTIANILEEVEDAVVFLTGLAEEEAAPAAEAAATPKADAAAEDQGHDGPRRPAKGITSREEALSLLDEIGQYFRRTEPHSPLSYTIADLVRRGRMPLPDLLAELLQDAGARNSLLTAAGIRPVQNSGQ
ncbi:MAG: type VI secretion system protein TssA [Azospirillaceae bacterium]|nr:type VI secretion system protein TssA [Azospirillaceae bacterium]